LIFKSHLRALALQSIPSSSYPLLLFSVHLFVLLFITRLAHWPLWVAPLILIGASLPPLKAWRQPETLAPLGLLYLVAGLRLLIVYGLHQEAPPELSYEWAVGLSSVWVALIGLRRRLQWMFICFVFAATILMSSLLWINLPAGVTGSDPFAYLQMGIDLAQHGTPLHRFPLAPFAAHLGLPTLPTTHIGYVLPNAEGLAPTVWPPGYSALLALAYLVGGEPAMLRLNVLIALVNLGLTAGWAALLCPPRWRRLPVVVGCGAALILATSPEQLTRLIVPLADGAAQLFTLLTLLITVHCSRLTRPPQRFFLAALGGLCLAAAYSIRYTQVLIAPGVALLLWFTPAKPRERLTLIALTAATALLGALPDMFYRTQLYGAFWRFGTGELALFNWSSIPEALARLSAELFAPQELGWLWPFAVLGALYLWRRNRRLLSGVLAFYAPLVIFHSFYPFLRLRDLLSLYPLLAALAALGFTHASLWLWLLNTRRGEDNAFVSLPVLRRALIVATLFALGLFRLNPILGFQHGFFTFGYLNHEQRLALDSLATLTEPKAVIACSLNSGAVEFYGGRATVRPGRVLQPGLSWSDAEWLAMVSALRAEGRPLYVLLDSPEMDAPLAALQTRYSLTPVARLPLPVYFAGGGSQNLTALLYRVTP